MSDRSGSLKHLQILHTVAGTVSRSLDVDEVLRIALDALTDVTGHEISSLHLVSADGATLRLRGDRGLSPRLREINQALTVGQGLIGTVAATGQTLNMRNVTEAPNLLPAARAIVQEEGMRAFLCVPINSRGRRLGTLSLGRQNSEPFEAPDVVLVEATADQIGPACTRRRAGRSRSCSASRPSSFTPRSCRRWASSPPVWPTRSTTRSRPSSARRTCCSITRTSRPTCATG